MSYLASLPILSRPELGEDLFLYLAISDHVVSLVLIKHHERIQKPICYINKTLVDAKTRYLPLEKMVLALVHTIWKLLHYFQAHTVWVLTKYPLQSLLRRSDFMRRIAKWGTKLGTFNICYKPRNSIKGQVLPDFVVELTPPFKASLMICQVTVR